MKPGIHPKWYPAARVVCACGNVFTVGATVAEISTEVCADCHPFFTGEQRIVDTAGQVDRFMRRLEAGVQQRADDRQRRIVRQQAEREAMLKRRGLTPIKARRLGKKPVLGLADSADAGDTR
jgi:large subunit ribosomal protein L31